jgi:hypothetical protein
MRRNSRVTSFESPRWELPVFQTANPGLEPRPSFVPSRGIADRWINIEKLNSLVCEKDERLGGVPRAVPNAVNRMITGW